MAILWVTPYEAVEQPSGGVIVPCLREPPLSAPLAIDFTSGAAKGSAALPSGTRFVELMADAACHWTLQDQSASAAATTADKPLPANLPIVRSIPPGAPAGGWGVSAIAAA